MLLKCHNNYFSVSVYFNSQALLRRTREAQYSSTIAYVVIAVRFLHIVVIMPSTPSKQTFSISSLREWLASQAQLRRKAR